MLLKSKQWEIKHSLKKVGVREKQDSLYSEAMQAVMTVCYICLCVSSTWWVGSWNETHAVYNV